MTNRMAFGRIKARLLVFGLLVIRVVCAYDFANLPIKVSSRSTQDAAFATSRATKTTGEHVDFTSSPVQWFLSHIYGRNETITNERKGDRGSDEETEHGKATRPFTSSDDEQQMHTYVEAETHQHEQQEQQQQEEAVRYNVSGLGLKDPFAHYSTKLTYDYSIKVGEPHTNGHGSMLSKLNGTIFPLGSVGAMMALGWSGKSNESHSAVLQHNGGAKGSASTTTLPHNDKNATTVTSSGGSTARNTSSTATAASRSNDGLTGVWLALTSKHALTGGYTLHAKQLSTTNNVVFHNVTFRSNLTIDAQGKFSFTFTLGTVDERDQAASSAASDVSKEHSMMHSVGSPMAEAQRPQNTSAFAEGSTTQQQQQPLQNPTHLDGPRCVELKSTTNNNTEAVFRMHCEGFKVDLNDM